MLQTKRITRMALMLAAVAAVATASVRAEEAKEDLWDHGFKGHEMWLTSLDSGLAVSARENRPMLADFYSRH